MLNKTKKSKTVRMLFFITIFISLFFWFFEKSPASYSAEADFSLAEKNIKIKDGDFSYKVFSKTKTVGELLAEQKLNLKEQDYIFPERQDNLYSGDTVIINRLKKIYLTENGNKSEMETYAQNVEKAIWENGKISLAPEDITVPQRNSRLTDGMNIKITHVVIKEEIKNEAIEFKTVTNEDDELGWRIKKTTQKGEKGNYEAKYKVVFYDGKEISRKLLEKNKTKDPTTEIVTQGTFVKVGKVHTGVASWYAFRGGLFAANPWLPMGSYVRVINQENGKSVIVQINDRGPFGNGRIIDLDKVAFSQIASIGAGVTNVKMEVITN